MDPLYYHTMEPPDLTRPDKPMRGYLDFGNGRILPCGLTDAERLQGIIDSERRSRDVLSRRLHARCAELRRGRSRGAQG